MSPFAKAAKTVSRVADMGDSKSDFAYGKTWGLAGVITVCVFHAMGNPMETSQAYLVVFATIGPTMLKILAERISISIGKAISEVSRTINTATTTHTKTSPNESAAVEPGD